MKQNELNSNSIVPKLEIPRSKTSRQEKQPEKAIYSPRFITRKKQNKEIPGNAFQRRKQSTEENNVFRYVSPKRPHTDEVSSFLSDEVKADILTYDLQQKSMFDLNFSRINCETQNELSCAKNLFDDMNCSNETYAQNTSLNVHTSKTKKQEHNFEVCQKIGLSLLTMPQSPDQKHYKLLKEKCEVLRKRNVALQQQIQSLTKQKTTLQQQKIQLSQQLEERKRKVDELQDQLCHYLRSHSTEILPKLNQMQLKLELSHQNIQNLQQSKSNLLEELSVFQQRVDHFSTLIFKKQLHIEQLNSELIETREEVFSKVQYSKNLEDVILQLNETISTLKQQNEGLLDQRQQNIELKDFFQQMEFIIEQKKCQLEQTQLKLEQTVNTLHLYEFDLTDCHRKIEQLILEKSQAAKKSVQFQVQSLESGSTENKTFELLRQQIDFLQNLIKEEKQVNDILRKQITYKELQTKMQKRQSYDFQKLNKQRESLKARNKKLMKKLNQVMEENSQLKQKFDDKKKKQHKQNALGKQHLISLGSQNQETSNEKQADLQNQRFNQKLMSLKNKWNSFYDHSQKQHSSRNKKQEINSDEELSFKLSPEKK